MPLDLVNYEKKPKKQSRGFGEIVQQHAKNKSKQVRRLGNPTAETQFLQYFVLSKACPLGSVWVPAPGQLAEVFRDLSP